MQLEQELDAVHEENQILKEKLDRVNEESNLVKFKNQLLIEMVRWTFRFISYLKLSEYSLRLQH